MIDWKQWLRKTTSKDSPTRKLVGVILIVLGFLAFVTPFTPGSWLIFVGLEIFGIRFAVWDRLRSRTEFSSLLTLPKRGYLIIGIVIIALALNYFFPSTQANAIMIAVAIIGGIPTALSGLRGFSKFSITIEGFNLVALIISFILEEYQSAAFIVLMLTFASILEWRTAKRTHNAVAELLALKPRTATLEKNGKTSEVPAETIRENDIIVIKSGARVPADGVVVSGSIFMNEAPVTGESVPVIKEVGDMILSGTLGDSGAAKVRVTRAGKESTIERMAVLIHEAAKNKSKSERVADRFASIFLPLILLLGAGTYYFTRNAHMTAAIFLVACADDMAVAIPLAVNAAIGSAAKRGVVVKGGEWLHTLSKVKTIVLDKTGTLTYGNFSLSSVNLEKHIDQTLFWQLVGAAEKYSDHPVGRAIFKEAIKFVSEIPEHEKTFTYKGDGIWAKVGGHEVAIGDEGILERFKIKDTKRALEALNRHKDKAETAAIVLIDGKFAGSIGIADTPRPEARASLQTLRSVGVERIAIFTGDNAEVAQVVANSLGVDEVLAGLSPEEKLKKLELMPCPLAMIGDGINDAPALARADVSIAMGGGGAAVAVEAADIVILTDNLSRLPEMILLGRRTGSVIKWDIIIWTVSNCLGFALVFAGFLTPALAAFYNFVTDFLPLVNSSRLFRERKDK